MGGKIAKEKVAWLCMNCDYELSQSLNDPTQSELEAHEDEWNKLIKASHE